MKHRAKTELYLAWNRYAQAWNEDELDELLDDEAEYQENALDPTDSLDVPFSVKDNPEVVKELLLTKWYEDYYDFVNKSIQEIIKDMENAGAHSENDIQPIINLVTDEVHKELKGDVYMMSRDIEEIGLTDEFLDEVVTAAWDGVEAALSKFIDKTLSLEKLVLDQPDEMDKYLSPTSIPV